MLARKVGLGVEQPTVAKAVARMARKGLVEIGADEHDARVTHLYLTDKGNKLVGPIVRCWQALDDRMGQGLSPAERDQLRALLIRCAHNLTIGEPGGPRT